MQPCDAGDERYYFGVNRSLFVTEPLRHSVKMQKAKCKKQNEKWKKCKMQNAKSKKQNAKCKNQKPKWKKEHTICKIQKAKYFFAF